MPELNQKMDISSLRESYRWGGFSESEAAADPFLQFQHWFQDAVSANLREPNAMTLATVDASGQPSARIVLLKGADERGFVFFTNYQSHKANDLAANPRCSLVFFWNELERQVRISGSAQKLTEEESTAYFQSRPRESQLGAWASPQSRQISDRQFLSDQLSTLEKQFADADPLPKPPFWGGFLVVPHEIEFWQGRVGRLHDRLAYRRAADGWQLVRLAP
jgi:pyridoxamine 5'-phosphate oxidase